MLYLWAIKECAQIEIAADPSKTLIQTEVSNNKLDIFQRKTLQRILDPIKEKQETVSSFQKRSTLRIYQNTETAIGWTCDHNGRQRIAQDSNQSTNVRKEEMKTCGHTIDTLERCCNGQHTKSFWNSGLEKRGSAQERVEQTVRTTKACFGL